MKRLTSVTVSRLPSATMGVEPLVQLNVRSEPEAEHVRTTVLLFSMASSRSDLTTTLDTGTAEKCERYCNPCEIFSLELEAIVALMKLYF